MFVSDDIKLRYGWLAFKVMLFYVKRVTIDEEVTEIAEAAIQTAFVKEDYFI